MSTAIITGSAGLVGSESVEYFSSKFDNIIGIDNNMREYFFGQEGSTEWNKNKLEKSVSNYKHYKTDIRNYEALENVFREYGTDVKFIVHTAAQPSHDWAAKEPGQISA